MRFLAFLMIFLGSFPLMGQYRTQLIPRSSPDKLIYQKVGYTDIEITYGSPKVKGRKIWGELVPIDQIWRCGANEATTVYFSDDVEIENQPLAKGRYALFMIPKLKGPWVIIFNRIYDQWGSYSYKEEFDVLRVSVTPDYQSKFTEDLLYRIEQLDFQKAKIRFDWEDITLNIKVATKFQSNLAKTLEEELEKSSEETHWVVYLQAAEFLIEHDLGIDQALSWLESSEKLSYVNASEWSNQFYPIEFIKGHLYWTFAKAYALKKDYGTALKYANQLKEIEGEETFYNWENEAENIDTTISEWTRLN